MRLIKDLRCLAIGEGDPTGGRLSWTFTLIVLTVAFVALVVNALLKMVMMEVGVVFIIAVVIVAIMLMYAMFSTKLPTIPIARARPTGSREAILGIVAKIDHWEAGTGRKFNPDGYDWLAFTMATELMSEVALYEASDGHDLMSHGDAASTHVVNLICAARDIVGAQKKVVERHKRRHPECEGCEPKS